jgi:hypothetical protein
MQPSTTPNLEPVCAISPAEPLVTNSKPAPLGGTRKWRDVFNSGLPVVPAMPASLARLELMLREPAPDLHALSELIRNDLGLTIQTLRLVGADFNRFEGTPCRIQDCVVHLGCSSLLLATPALKQAAIWENRAALAELWSHSRQVAYWTAHLARTANRIDGEKAYLAGLLHDIGSLPVLLGWRLPGVDYRDRVEVACALAESWQFPYFVLQGIRYRDQRGEGRSALGRLVAAAHQRVTEVGRLP